jgi:hypothetical protein
VATHFSRLLRHAWVTVGLFLIPWSPHEVFYELKSKNMEGFSGILLIPNFS